MKINQIKKQISRIEKYTPHKKKDLFVLRSQLVTLENKSFSQEIFSFRKKQSSFNQVENRVLGKVSSLSLRGFDNLSRDKLNFRGEKKV